MTLFALNKTGKTYFKENLMKLITLSRKNTLKIPTFLILQIDTQIDHPTNFKENIENILPIIWNTELHKIRIRKIHQQTHPWQGKNPTDKHSNYTRRFIAKSINHWVPNCPHNQDNTFYYEIVLLTWLWPSIKIPLPCWTIKKFCSSVEQARQHVKSLGLTPKTASTMMERVRVSSLTAAADINLVMVLNLQS